jgi:hypothetical protein
VIQDPTDYNRVHEMFDVLQSSKSRLKTQAEGFGLSRDMQYLDTLTTLSGITSYQPVAFEQLSGVLIQVNQLPLRCWPWKLN